MIAEQEAVAFPDTSWYQPTADIREFLTDQSFVRVLVGGRGSSKTFGGVCMDLVKHCWNVPGAKCNIVRLTEASQKDSTIDTFHKFFAKMGPMFRENGLLFKSWNNGRSFRVPSQMAVEKLREAQATLTTRAEIATWIAREGARYCGMIEMRGIPDNVSAQSKFRGMECSRMVFVEADQMKRSDFNLSFACLRWAGADPATCDDKGFIIDQGIVVDTNPPSPKHWIAEMEAEETEKPQADQRMRFWHLKTDDNIHNLPADYIETQIMLPYAQNPAMIERMRYGRYADAFEGKPVYYAYRRPNHEFIPQLDPKTGKMTKLGWPRGATMVCSMDVGTNNATAISAYKQHGQHLYWWTLREIILTGSDTDRQCEELLKMLANEFPFWNAGGDICPQTLFFCDPAARNSAFTARGPTSSALKVMHSHGIYPGMKTGAHLQPTIAAVNRLLQQNHQTAAGTVWHFKIDPERCPTLTRALRGLYRYPTKDEPGFGNDQPLKGQLAEHCDHIADAFRYGVINVIDIAQEQHQGGMRSNTPAPSNPEPSRTI